MCSTVASLSQAESRGISLADFATAAFQKEAKQIGMEVFGLFDSAISRSLQHPRIRLKADNGEVVVLRIAGPRSQFSGEILVVGEGYPSSFYGHIDRSGFLHQSRHMTLSISNLLEEFGNDPRAVAFRYGRLTGCCCFCGAKLTDARSVALGFGEQCAENYGFKWVGDRKLRGYRGSLYFELVAAKQDFEQSKAGRIVSATRVYTAQP